MTTMAEYVDGLPNICGQESLIAEATGGAGPVFLAGSDIDFGRIKSAFAVALHMHQPLIPAGGDDLQRAEIISNLKHMADSDDSQDSYNASVFHQCYKRIGVFLPELVAEGKSPRVMLDYSGTLLDGLRRMGLDDVIDKLRTITCEPAYRGCVEWLGTAWGHPVAPSTPVQDYRLHVLAWQHFFAGMFGLEALSRVKGFSPCEMALPNHPDVGYEFVKTLKECGYRWVLVQEHTVENAQDGGPVRYAHCPHRLVARNSCGQSASITAVIKTQGSDTKLIGQMQPYYEALNLGRVELGGKSVPSLVTQIADGENGGVMMNEFPGKYRGVMGDCSGTETPAVNVTEYLEHLEAVGISEEDLPAVQPIMQHRIWQQLEDGAGPDELAKVIEELQRQDDRFHMEGGSWTGNISWVRGYESMLKPMEAASAMFNAKVLNANVPSSEKRYHNALYHLLLTQTSCYRYWGEGLWSDYGRELCRRTIDILERDF